MMLIAADGCKHLFDSKLFWARTTGACMPLRSSSDSKAVFGSNRMRAWPL
jgi:hypothetical protein